MGDLLVLSLLCTQYIYFFIYIYIYEKISKQVYFLDFSKAFDSIHRGKIRQILYYSWFLCLMEYQLHELFNAETILGEELQ